MTLLFAITVPKFISGSISKQQQGNDLQKQMAFYWFFVTLILFFIMPQKKMLSFLFNKSAM